MSNAQFCQAQTNHTQNSVSPNKIRGKTHFYPLLNLMKNIFHRPAAVMLPTLFNPLRGFLGEWGTWMGNGERLWGNGEWLLG